MRGLPWLAAMVGLVAAWLIAVPRTGYPGAALVVTSLATLPPFLYQALQPMSDVPALAAWLLALALASRPSAPALAGAAVATLLADRDSAEPRAARPRRGLAGMASRPRRVNERAVALPSFARSSSLPQRWRASLP